MPVVRNLTGKQFGSKIQELFKLIETEENWEQYVSDDAKKIIKSLYKNKNMTNTLEELNIKYPTARAHIVKSLERIQNKKLNYLRNGKAVNAQELLKLTETPGWEVNLTQREISLVNEFKDCKNVYEVGRRLNVSPGNVYATLYGNTQKQGVLSKIESNK